VPILLGAAAWTGALLAVRFSDAYFNVRAGGVGYRPQGKPDDLNTLRFAGYELAHQVLGGLTERQSATDAAILLSAALECLLLLERER
jgi:hypothetical protein